MHVAVGKWAAELSEITYILQDTHYPSHIKLCAEIISVNLVVETTIT